MTEFGGEFRGLFCYKRNSLLIVASYSDFMSRVKAYILKEAFLPDRLLCSTRESQKFGFDTGRPTS